MRIYFFGSKDAGPIYQRLFQTALTALRKDENWVLSNLSPDHFGVTAEELAQMKGGEGMLLDKVDAMVIEGSTPDPEIGYLLAYAIAQKKPTLYLFDRSARRQSILRYLPVRRLPTTMTVKPYAAEEIESLLGTFLMQVALGETGGEVPRIKFTLRLTPQIDRYLAWKVKGTKMSKADFLRKAIVEEIVKKDEEWRKRWEEREKNRGSQSASVDQEDRLTS